MTSLSNDAPRCAAALLLAGALLLAAGCASAADPPAKPSLPPPEIVQAMGTAMLTTHGYLYPEDPPGTRRSSRPQGFYIYPCSDWAPWQGLTDEYGKTVEGPFMISGSVTLRYKPGVETLTVSVMTEHFGPPHPATRSVVVGSAAPLGPHWTWQLKKRPGQIPVLDPGQTLVAEAQADGSVEFHYAQVGTRKGGGTTSASLMVECLIEWYGTPGWELGTHPPSP
jgi:hypothetical protein